MKQNVRKTDKIIRLIIATVLVILNLTGIITGVLSIVFFGNYSNDVFYNFNKLLPFIQHIWA